MKYFVVLMGLLCGCATTTTSTPNNDPDMIEVQSWQKQNPDVLLVSEANDVVFINGKSVYKLPAHQKTSAGQWRVHDKQLVALIKKRKGNAKACAVITSRQQSYPKMMTLAYACGQTSLNPKSWGTGTSIIENGRLKHIKRQYSIKPHMPRLVVTKNGVYLPAPNKDATSFIDVLIFATKSGYMISVGRGYPAIPIYPECTEKTLRCVNHSLDSVGRQLSKLRKRYPTAYLQLSLMGTADRPASKVIQVGQHLSHIERKNIVMNFPGEQVFTRDHFTYGDLDDIEMPYGLCDKPEIRKVVRAQKDNILMCFNTSLAKHSHIQGKWWATWDIKPDGSTKRIRIKPVLKSQHHPPFETCFIQALGQMKYKPGKRVCPVRYPFILNND